MICHHCHSYQRYTISSFTFNGICALARVAFIIFLNFNVKTNNTINENMLYQTDEHNLTRIHTYARTHDDHDHVPSDSFTIRK